MVRAFQQMRTIGLEEGEDWLNGQMRDMERDGLASPKVSAFNAWVTEYTKYNKRHPRPHDDSRLATIFKQMVNDLSKDIEGKLAQAIATKKAESGLARLNLPQLQVVIVTLLSAEQRSDARREARERGGKAYKAGEKGGDPRKNRKGKKGDKNEDSGPEWTAIKGKCKYCGKGAASGPDKGHWQRKCPLLIANGGNIDPSTWVADKGAAKMGRGVNQEHSEESCSDCDEDDESSGNSEGDANPFGAATGSTTVPLDSVASPRELMAALTGGGTTGKPAKEAGHAKMGKAKEAAKEAATEPVLVVVTPGACAGTAFKAGIHFSALEPLAAALRLRYPDCLPSWQINQVATLEEAVRVAAALNTPTRFEMAHWPGHPLARPAELFGRPYAPGSLPFFAVGEEIMPPQSEDDGQDASDDDGSDDEESEHASSYSSEEDESVVPMGTPVPSSRPRISDVSMLTPDSPMKDFHAFAEGSPLPAVKKVVIHCGGKNKRTRADILRELQVAPR